MSISRRTTMGLFAGAVSAMMLGAPAFADGATVMASLWDKGDDSLMTFGEVAPMGLAMENADMSQATMGITRSQSEIPAGEITFQATNDSTFMIHEMVLAPITDVNTELPYVADLNKVDEDAAGHLGEVAELDPGDAGALTVTLEPGTYILYCNIPAHYAMGMWTTFTVTQ